MELTNLATFNLLREMSAFLEDLLKLYTEVPLVIAREHQAIAERSLPAMELASEEKKAVSLQIELALKKLFECLLNLEGLEERTLSACLRIFKSHKNDGADRLEYNASVSKFEKNVEQLLDVLPKVQVQIEMNKLIVNRFLNYYRESLKFWSDIIGERTSLYGATGKRQSQETAIQLSTEA